MLGNYHRHQMGATLVDLRKVKVYRPPDAGQSWKGISHYAMVEQVLNTLSEKDLQIKGMRWHLSRNDNDIAFSCNIIMPELPSGRVVIDNESIPLFPAFGFIASNTRRHRLTFYAGWSNPDGLVAFCGRRWLGPRYTTNADQRQAIQDALNLWEASLPRVWKMKRKLEKVRYGPSQLDKVLLKAAQKNIVPFGRIKRTAKQVAKVFFIRAWDLAIELSRWVPMNPPIYQMNQLYNFTAFLLEQAKKKEVDTRA